MKIEDIITKQNINYYIQYEKDNDPQIHRFLELRKKVMLTDEELKEFEGCTRAIRGNTYYWVLIQMLNANDNEEFYYD